MQWNAMGILRLDEAVREGLLSMSAATVDRLLTTVRDTAKQAGAER